MNSSLFRLATVGVLGLLLAIAEPAAAGELDGASQEALDKTQGLLTNKAERDKAVRGDAKAEAADAKVQALPGSAQDKEAIYGISSEIFADLAKEANGDPVKMQEIMAKAQADPQGFYNSLSKKNQQSIEEAAKKMSPADGRAPSAQH